MAAVVATANARIALRASIQSVELNLTEISIIVGWPAGSRSLIINYNLFAGQEGPLANLLQMV